MTQSPQPSDARAPQSKALPVRPRFLARSRALKVRNVIGSKFARNGHL